MKYISLFSGIEAASVAWRKLKWTPLAFAEIEPFPCAVLAHHWPHVPNHGDVTAFDWSVYRDRCQILVGGSPCQSFSVAGLRGSLSDDRGNLALAFCKITHAINPEFVVYENVPGILSTKDNAFGCLLAGLVGSSVALASGLEAGRWPDAGMVVGPVRSAAWRVLDAQGAVPQRRRRVFVVSCRVSDGINPGAILFEPEANLVECLGNWDRSGSLFFVSKGVRRNSKAGREAGPSVAASLARGADSSGKGGYAGRRREDDTNIVGYGVSGHAGYREGTGTLRAHGGDRGGDQKSSSQVNRSNPQPGDPCHTLAKGADAPAIAFQERGRQGGPNIETQADLAYSLTSPNGGGRRQEMNVATPTMAVRRLTPLECERLQGFPDGHTKVEFRGKLAADGPRYRAIGNSMAVPVLEWIGRRILAAMEVPHV